MPYQRGPVIRKAKKKPAPRSDAAQRTGARTPKPKPAPKPVPVQRGHASEDGQTIRPKTIRKVVKAQERANRGKSDAAQGNATRDAEAFKRTPEYKQSLVTARRARIRRAIERHEPIPKRSSATATKGPKLRYDVESVLLGQPGQKAATPGSAGVLKVLEQTTRPLHGVAAGTRAAVAGKNVPKAALKGLKNEDKSTFSDVLKDIGAPKAVRSVGGFVLDVAADPTTYVTGGTGAVAKKTALSAAKRAEKKAAAKGLSEKQVKRFGERAARQAEKTADQAKGVTVRVAGKEVPGVRRATAKAGKGAGKVIRRTTPERARTGVRSALGDVNPNIAPAGVAKEAHEQAVRATRTARAQASRGRDRAQKRGIGLKRKVSEEDYSRIIDAIESGSLKGLPNDLRAAAIAVRSDLRYANRQRKQAGIRGGERKNYVPHQLTEETLEAEGKKAAQGHGTKTIKPSYSKKREETRPLKELREDQPGRYSEDLPSLVANRVARGAEDAARATLNRRLADMGRPVKRGQDVSLKPGEAVFHIKGSDIREVTDKAEIAKAARPLVLNKKGTKLKGANKAGGRYVVLNSDVVKRATEGVRPQLEGPGIVKGLDRLQGGFKRVALATPGYHVRNFLGDSFNAYLEQAGHRLPGNIARAGRVLKASGRKDVANLKLEQFTPGKGKMKTGRYGELTYDESAEQLARHGAFRTGFTAKEIPELAASGKTGVSLKSKVPQGVKRFFLNREDLPRVATAIEKLRKGATWEEAASVVAGTHFDYQHLTRFERNIARRAAPFYTFTARNIPLQARKLVTNPGKYAQYQKIREEAAKATGMDEDARQARALFAKLQEAGVNLPDGWEMYLSEWEQRNAGVPVSWKGKTFTVSFALPLGDLSELPGAAGKAQFQEYFQKAMSLTTPIVKNPLEYFSNYSFFFRDQIQREYSPNVAAPAYVGAFPDALKKDIGVVKIRDKRTGEMVWAWPAKVDYIAKAVPGTPAFVQNMMTGGADRRGRKDFERVLGFLGVKAVPVDPITTAVNLAYKRMDEIAEAKGSLNQQGIDAEHITPEYRRLLDQEKILREIAYQGKQMRGDAVLPTAGGPSKRRVRRAPTSSSSSSGFDLSAIGGSSSGSSSAPKSSGGFDLSGLD